MDEPTTSLENEFPSVDLAYPIAMSSFEWAHKRFEAVEARAQAALTFAATATIAVIPLALTKGLPASSPWLIGAVLAFLAGVVLATWARVGGRMNLVSPAILFEKWLHLPPWEFQKDMIYFSGQAWDANRVLVTLKQRLVILATLTFAFETILVVVWVGAGVVR